MKTLADLERALEEYREGTRGLPTYEELAELVAHESES